jgi:hypothetical protein
MITNGQFRTELDKILKARKMLKKARSEYIGDLIANIPSNMFDEYLDVEQEITAKFLSERSEAKRVPTEHKEQSDFVLWFRKTYPGVLIAARPNGGLRSASEARGLVLEGVVAGMPDLDVPEWDFFIEFKRAKGGVVSDDQVKIISHLCSIGKHVIVAKGFEEAKLLTLDFVEMINSDIINK